jgi:carbon monoxide dehydrogenase subunit G
MAHYHAIVDSSRPVQDTFDYLATFSNAAEWDPGTLTAVQLDLGPVRVGTRFRLTVPFLGRRLPLTYEVTQYAPPHEVVLHATSSLLSATDSIVVSADGNGAKVSYSAEIRLRGPLVLLDPLLGRGFAAVGDRATNGLAQALSSSRSPSRAPSPFPFPSPESGS